MKIEGTKPFTGDDRVGLEHERMCLPCSVEDGLGQESSVIRTDET
jgi:hypothetical protein